MRNLSERNKPIVLQDKLNKIQEQINIAAAKSETEIWLDECYEEEIIDALIAAGYDINKLYDAMDFYRGIAVKW
jgi:hypothetical protein